MKPALLVIDVQKCYLPMMAAEDTALAMPRINWAIRLFREKNLPIIRVYHDDPGKYPEPGDADFEFPRHLLITDKDPKIIKNYGDAFYKTELANKLKELKVNTIFLCGLSATGCVLATYFGASENDIKPFMLKDPLISANATHTNQIEDIFNAISLGPFKFMVDFLSD
jgi:nicotinamidase-related amidase